MAFEFGDFLKMYDLKILKLKGSLKNITNLVEVLQSAIRSNAKSVAFASAVKIEDPSGIRIVSEKSPDTTAHPTTFISSFEPSV